MTAAKATLLYPIAFGCLKKNALIRMSMIAFYTRETFQRLLHGIRAFAGVREVVSRFSPCNVTE
jgi:hypothetical protein